MPKCNDCGMEINFDGKVWVDSTGGDVCTENVNERHEPEDKGFAD